MLKFFCDFFSWWLFHTPITRDTCDRWGYSTFSKFVREYSKYDDWRWDGNLLTSKKCPFYTAIGSSITSFNNDGMVFSFGEYRKYKKWFDGEEEKRRTVKW